MIFCIVHLILDDIPSSIFDIGNDSDFMSGKDIEKTGFSDIRTSDDSDSCNHITVKRLKKKAKSKKQENRKNAT